jgi:hypothetical protein
VRRRIGPDDTDDRIDRYTGGGYRDWGKCLYRVRQTYRDTGDKGMNSEQCRESDTALCGGSSRARDCRGARPAGAKAATPKAGPERSGAPESPVRPQAGCAQIKKSF